MSRAFWMLVLAACATLTPARADDDVRARKLLEEAFNRRYRWSDQFQGFSADFTVTREGKTVKGTVKADATKPHGGITVECADADIKKLVSDTVGSTVTHTHTSTFESSFGSCTFALAGEGSHGGTKIALTGHGFFKDFTVKDGNIIENHGGHGEMATEVKVTQVVWIAESGKTIPRAYSFTIKTGDREQSGKNVESWSEIDGVLVPTRWHLSRNEGSAAAVESTIMLENIKISLAGR
jgi:hypothetical protein